MSKMLFFLTILLGFGLAGCSTEPEAIIEDDNGTLVFDREAFKKRAEARLQEFELRLEELRNKAIDTRAEVGVKLRQEIDELHKKQVVARQRLTEIWQSGTEKWEEEKLRMEDALEDLREGFERAFSHVP